LAVLAIIALMIGLVDESLYNVTVAAENINKFLRVGSMVQDIITVPLSAMQLGLSVLFLRSDSYKIFIAMLGWVHYVFYGYRLYML
jgi:hypothetical protein